MTNILAKINHPQVFTAVFAALVGFNAALAILKIAA